MLFYKHTVQRQRLKKFQLQLNIQAKINSNLINMTKILMFRPRVEIKHVQILHFRHKFCPTFYGIRTILYHRDRR